MASIKTQVFGGAYSQCVMEFSYHVYGRNIGLFEIDLLNNGTEYSRPTKMFEVKGISCLLYYHLTIKKNFKMETFFSYFVKFRSVVFQKN